MITSKDYRMMFVGALIMLLSGVAYTPVAAKSVIVVGANSILQAITNVELQRLWLGRIDQVDGQKLERVESKDAGTAKDDFCSEYLGKSRKKIKKYFIKEALKGGATPPKDVANTDALIKELFDNPLAISFMDESKVVSGKVKVIKVSE